MGRGGARDGWNVGLYLPRKEFTITWQAGEGAVVEVTLLAPRAGLFRVVLRLTAVFPTVVRPPFRGEVLFCFAVHPHRRVCVYSVCFPRETVLPAMCVRGQEIRHLGHVARIRALCSLQPLFVETAAAAATGKKRSNTTAAAATSYPGQINVHRAEWLRMHLRMAKFYRRDRKRLVG